MPAVYRVGTAPIVTRYVRGKNKYNWENINATEQQ